MNLNLRQKIIYLFFGLSIIYGGYNFLADSGNKKTVPPPSVAEQTSTPPAPPPKSIDIDKYSSLEWGRDPFYRPLAREHVSVKSKPGSWVLNGILYDSITPAAIINKRIVHAGDKIDGATIEEITDSNVKIKINDSEYRTLEIVKDRS